MAEAMAEAEPGQAMAEARAMRGAGVRLRGTLAAVLGPAVAVRPVRGRLLVSRHCWLR